MLLLGVVVPMMVASYLIKQNEVTRTRVEIPKLNREIAGLKESLRTMQYEIDAMETPERLLELARLGEFSHLKFPKYCEIVKANETLLEKEEPAILPKSPLVVGSIQ